MSFFGILKGMFTGAAIGGYMGSLDTENRKVCLSSFAEGIKAGLEGTFGDILQAKKIADFERILRKYPPIQHDVANDNGYGPPIRQWEVWENVAKPGAPSEWKLYKGDLSHVSLIGTHEDVKDALGRVYFSPRNFCATWMLQEAGMS